jgi:dsDNA-specific endonuclease/ATPase MutS2
MKEVNNDKRVLQVELDNNVKKVAITGKDADDKVVMRQELNEDELDNVAGGVRPKWEEVCLYD